MRRVYRCTSKRVHHVKTLRALCRHAARRVAKRNTASCSISRPTRPFGSRHPEHGSFRGARSVFQKFFPFSFRLTSIARRSCHARRRSPFELPSGVVKNRCVSPVNEVPLTSRARTFIVHRIHDVIPPFYILFFWRGLDAREIARSQLCSEFIVYLIGLLVSAVQTISTQNSWRIHTFCIRFYFYFIYLFFAVPRPNKCSRPVVQVLYCTQSYRLSRLQFSVSTVYDNTLDMKWIHLTSYYFLRRFSTKNCLWK